MHVRAAERGRVVALVVQRVHVLVKKFAHVGDPVDLPRVHPPVDEPKMGDAPVRDRQRPERVAPRRLAQVTLHRQRARRPVVAQRDLDPRAAERRERREERVVLDLVK